MQFNILNNSKLNVNKIRFNESKLVLCGHLISAERPAGYQPGYISLNLPVR